jgi:hypothetical protein
MLKQFPESFFYEILAQGSFIVDCLLALVESVENYINLDPPKFTFLDAEVADSIISKFKKAQRRTGLRTLALKKLLIDRFGYNLDEAQEEENEEDGPVVVENPTFFYKI